MHSRLLGLSVTFFGLVQLVVSGPVKALTGSAEHFDARATPTTANTVVLDGKRLISAKQHLKENFFATQLTSLRRDADSWLGKGPWSVIFKPHPPENGTLHDYSSQAPYWWPTKNKTDQNVSSLSTSRAPTRLDNAWSWVSLYRTRRVNATRFLHLFATFAPLFTGRTIHDVDTITDRLSIGAVCQSSYSLALTWYYMYTGDAKYSKKAATALCTWFLDPKTSMNPNLEHSQAVPCRELGRAPVIIDFSQLFTSVVDAVQILNLGATGWTKDDTTRMNKWNQQFLDWLVSSDLGKQASALHNNHAVFYDMQVAALSLSVGKRDQAKSVVSRAKSRIDEQIAPDSSQPNEAVRTRSWHYHCFNLVAFTRLAQIASHVGVDLWRYKGPKGQGLQKAIQFILPTALNQKK
ncbi:chondroitin AC/alginate lyase [Auriculariales sp. MPI-PUGE-AT-0066]|nr:chondroitin AC/alginate lyase [Auriculariales sp. MPI-PUGE-AT-0066]